MLAFQVFYAGFKCLNHRMKSMSRTIGVIVLVAPVVIWLLLPIEPTTLGVRTIGKVQVHFEARGNLASPKPYYRVALKDGLVVEVQDYGQVSAKIGDVIILQERIGVLTSRRTFSILGKSDGEYND